jgi:hypothetical protein
MPTPRFTFTAPLVKLETFGSRFVVEIPERVSKTIGKRGPVPIVATYNKIVEVQQSMVPSGGGRHRLQLSARTRGELEVDPGDRLHVVITVPEKPPVMAQPRELATALRENDLQETFTAFPVGKQNHIIFWIQAAAHPETRERRIAQTVEVAFRARERAYELKSKAEQRAKLRGGKS